MSTDVVVVQADARLREVVQRLAERNADAAVVSDATGAIGVVSTRDIVRALGGGADVDATWAADAMHPDLVSVTPEDQLGEISRVLVDGWIEHLPVIDDGVVVGMISAVDILRAAQEPDVRPVDRSPLAPAGS